MITATDRWKRPVIKVNGQTVTRPKRAVSLSPTVEESLIRMGFAQAFDPSLGEDDAIVDESEDETIIESDLGEEESEEAAIEPESPVKQTRKSTKK